MAWLGWMDLSQNITPPRAPCGAKNMIVVYQIIENPGDKTSDFGK